MAMKLLLSALLPGLIFLYLSKDREGMGKMTSQPVAPGLSVPSWLLETLWWLHQLFGQPETNGPS